ncbi:restriction endonuclease [Mycobacterium sp. Aquia_216]|uniref:restriction endonuclease n=1 Tax=Mycobacterium sp. Aquia_216 TaxID=2991729 RepID=UPI00227BD4D6|nr:restriction endonuclease [Mycobacterium sp. Aquia_216]WAJ46662.1 restriction endonuclease [Mycobacterium sp. Aquia_216]
MKTAFAFLPLYFGLLLGFFAHRVSVGLAGAACGLLFAALIQPAYRRSRRRLRTDAGIREIDAMEGVEFEDYVATRMQRAGWRVSFTPAVGDYGVDLIAEKDGQYAAIQCKRHGKTVGIAAVQQVVAGARHHGCTRSIVVSNQEFTAAAKQLAYTHGCQLIGRKALRSWVPAPTGKAALPQRRWGKQVRSLADP